MSDSYLPFSAWAAKQSGWNASRTSLRTAIFNVDFNCFPSLDDSAKGQDERLPVVSAVSASRGLTCIACQLVFLDLKEQQTHFKSDGHLETLRNKLAGTDSVSDRAPAATADGSQSNDSDHSSADECEETDDVESDYVVPLELKSSMGSIVRRQSAQQGATFHVRDNSVPGIVMVVSGGAIPSDSILSSRNWAVAGAESDKQRVWSTLGGHLRQLQTNPTVAVFLLRSGRFAGAVFSGSTLLIHKVVRRYTVRAKAGGGQSSHDNKAGKAKSMGAQLRRYGEQALREDVADCLRLWSGHLQGCSLVLVAAPKTMRSDLFSVEDTPGGSGASRGGVVLDRNDPRVVFVPFMVGRPTLEEARAVHARVTTVYFNADSPAADKEESETVTEQEPTAKPPTASLARRSSAASSNKAPSQRPEPLQRCEASLRLFEALHTGQEETVLAVLSEISQDPDQLFDLETLHIGGDLPASSTSPTAGEAAAPAGGSGAESIDAAAVVNLVESLDSLSSPLHLASAAGMARAVTQLLQLGASPMRGDARGRTPYFVARDKDTRDAFRWYRGTEEGSDRWEWDAAGVGPPLTEEGEREKQQREREKEKEKKRRAAQRKKEAKAREEQQAAEAALALERQRRQEEERAAATRDAAGLCAFCGVSLFGKHALDIYDRRCCSADCVVKHRRRLLADAATKRFGGSS